MTSVRRVLLAALAAAALVGVAAAPAEAYDAEAGRQKAEAICAGCHGSGGNSSIATVPSLAGQQARYIVLALYQFRAGNRKSEQMTQFAAPLSDDDLGNLGDYYSAQKPAAPQRATLDPQQAAAARLLAARDNCVQCHGPNLAGQEGVPRLAGLHSDYLKQQLQGFKAATRGDIDGNMSSAAQALSAADIDLLAQYISSLRIP